MNQPLIDDLARSLASPMSRRSSLALFGSTMAAAMVPSLLRPGGAFGSHCGAALKPCAAATGTGHFCCERDTECCSGSSGNACCDPCLGEL